MSILSWLANKFTKVVFVWHSELSNPTECERTYKEPRDQELEVLHILYMHGQMLARDIDKDYPSGGRRLNDLFHRGYVDNIGNRSKMLYKINDKGFNYLLNNHLRD